MKSSDVIVLLTVASFSGGLLLIVGRAWYTSGRKEARWKLFSVRDELCYLVASGVIPESNLAFQGTVKQLNLVVVNAQHFTYREFTRAYLQADKVTLDGQKRQRDYFAAVRDAPPELQVAVAKFYGTVLQVVVSNSLRLQAMLWSRRHARRAVQPLRPVLRRLITDSPALQAYNTSSARIASLPEVVAVARPLAPV
jgi:hypothetical protein